ncbi:MAG: hypothetical protein WDN01_12795 [Rhizomicrobium sp.]
MRHLILAAIAFLALAAPAAALSIRDCADDQATASAWNIAEPWEKNTKVFSNGNVRVALIDTGGEPVCCSMHLLVLSPNTDEQAEDRSCHLINDHEGLGFVGIDFARLSASYDPKKGLLISFPYALYNDEGGPQKQGLAKLRINSANGTVTAER